MMQTQMTLIGLIKQVTQEMRQRPEYSNCPIMDMVDNFVNNEQKRTDAWADCARADWKEWVQSTDENYWSYSNYAKTDDEFTCCGDWYVGGYIDYGYDFVTINSDNHQFKFTCNLYDKGSLPNIK